MDQTPTRSQLAGRNLFLELERAHERLNSEFALLFKQHGLSLAQFNVLRILRGADAKGLTCQEVGSRLIHRLPDVTRLLDRMETARLVSRERSGTDRREVIVKLTTKGRRKVDSLDEPVLSLHDAQVAHMSLHDAEALATALVALRERP